MGIPGLLNTSTGQLLHLRPKGRHGRGVRKTERGRVPPVCQEPACSCHVEWMGKTAQTSSLTEEWRQLRHVARWRTSLYGNERSGAPNPKSHMQATLERSSRLCSRIYSYDTYNNNKEKGYEFERGRDDRETGEGSEREMM